MAARALRAGFALLAQAMHHAVGEDMRASEGGAKAASWRDMPVEKRLAHALVKGIDEFAVVVSARTRAARCLNPSIDHNTLS